MNIEDMPVIIASGVLFGLYFKRMNFLNYKLHDWPFVMQNTVTAGACLYNVFTVYQDGLMPLRVFVPVIAGLWLFNSRTKAAEAQVLATMPAPLDEAFGRNRVWSRH